MAELALTDMLDGKLYQNAAPPLGLAPSMFFDGDRRSSLPLAPAPTEQVTVMIAVENAVRARQVARRLAAIADVVVIGHPRDEEAAVSEAYRLQPDVVVVAADHPGASGLRIAARLQQPDGPDVIVLSLDERNASPAFDVGAFDYLVLPVREDRLRQTVERVRRHRSERAALRARAVDWAEPVFHIPDRNGGRDIRVRDIVLIRAERDYALIHTGERTYLIRSTMGRLATKLPSSIVRVHRSAFVAIQHVNRWKTSLKGAPGLLLSNGAEVPVGPNYLARVRDATRTLDW